MKNPKKSILFLVPYPHNAAPSQRLKFEQYYEGFKKEDFRIVINPFIVKSFWPLVYKKGNYPIKIYYTVKSYIKRYYLLSNIRKYDVVYVHLWGVPFGLPVYEWFLCKISKKIIYDIDDLVYKANTSPNNKFLKFIKSSFKVNFLMKNADWVIVSTDKLLEYAKQFTTRLSLIPATIDITKYKIKSYSKDRIIIGWTGSHTTSKYLHLLDNVLKSIATIENVEIQVMGDPNFKMDGVNIKIVNWTSVTEAENISHFDIGLHPIPDEEWVYGKSGGKLVQYMAAGIPIVASAIGPNFAAVKEGYNGYLVRTEKEWIEKLLILINDQTLRKKMGNNSRTRAIDCYSIEANFGKYISIFNNLDFNETI